MLNRFLDKMKWYDDWDKANPVTEADYAKSAVIFGTLGGVLFVVAMLVAWGQPFATDSLQTGPRGTGMSVPEYKASLAKGDPSIAGVAVVETTSAAEIGPAGADYDPALVAAMRQWTGIPTLFGPEDSYQNVVGARMVEMTQNINENWDGHVNANAEVGVTCYTCHRGEAVPSDIWFQIDPINKATGGWAAVQNRVTLQSNYTSLPSDALRLYLLDGETISVHDLDSRVENLPGDPLIQHAERTYSLMNYFANSLGVNCVFCHNSRAFYDGGQVTPQWATASLGIQMVLELNNDYLLPLQDSFPEERLGAQGDVAKVACKTCHKGQQQPLQGTNVIADWPDLAVTAE